MTQSTSNDLWLLEEITGCPAGMVLLQAWVDATRNDLDLVLENTLESLPGGATAEWRSFMEHYTGCEDCNRELRYPGKPCAVAAIAGRTNSVSLRPSG